MTKVLIDPGSSGEHGWHGLQTVLECPRKYAFSLESSKEDSPATCAGTLIHIGLAHHYALMMGRTDVYDPVAAIHHAVANKYLDESGDPELWGDACQIAEKIVPAYMHHYDPEYWKPAAVEQVVGGMVSTLSEDQWHHYPYTQRVDLTVENKGLIYYVDHKTTSRLTKGSAKVYTMSGQMLGYQLLGRAKYGKDFGGVILNMIGLDGQFQRVPVEPGPVEDFRNTIIYANQLKEKFRGRPAAEWPAAFHEHACFTRYGQCPNFERCFYGV